MKNMEHIKKLLQKLAKDIEVLESPNSSQIDIDVCLNSIRLLYEEVKAFSNNSIPIITKTENKTEPESKNTSLNNENNKEKLKEIDLSNEKIDTEIENNSVDTHEKSEEIETPIAKTEPLDKQISEQDKNQERIKTSDAQVDLFANVTNSINTTSDKQVTIGEHLGANKKSLNETFAGKPDIVSKLSQKPITDIKAAIGIGDRFMFIRELFDGDNEKFNQTIEILNGLNNFDKAIEYIQSNFNWNIEDSTTKQFLNIVSRKYI
ncbi:MAG: hypothetical protein PHE08_06500 [Bacteroidales bacterium]|jgi:hypothetical protein|nr:hypothetical protein [Bacteroidales bacterium]MDY0160393.1 hypothetical protein [Bacteroidales bacterium]